MYIKQIVLENIRCFPKLEIEFSKPGTSALFLGDNGDGKSTVLRCLAMGLCDDSSAAALFRELSGTFVRHEPCKSAPDTGTKGYIKIDLESKEGDTYRIITQIECIQDFERVTQKLERIKSDKTTDELTPRGFPWGQIFVVGYGPGLRTGGTEDYQKYIAVDAVYPLFSYDQPLQNPELSIRRLMAAARDQGDDAERLILSRIQALMAELLDLRSPEDLQLSPDYFQLTPTGLEVKGFWGTAGISQLGDGYQATITWVLDLISWWFLREGVNKSNLDLKSIEGIVFIDEIEQHLHPKWQHRILPSLKKRLPNVQFIIATHSPLVASSSKDVEVRQFKEGRQLDPEKVMPYGWLAEDVYDMMGLEDSRSEEFQKVLARYDELDLKRTEGHANEAEIAEWQRLRDDLVRRLPEGDPAELTLHIANIAKSSKAEE